MKENKSISTLMIMCSAFVLFVAAIVSAIIPILAAPNQNIQSDFSARYKYDGASIITINSNYRYFGNENFEPLASYNIENSSSNQNGGQIEISSGEFELDASKKELEIEYKITNRSSINEYVLTFKNFASVTNANVSVYYKDFYAEDFIDLQMTSGISSKILISQKQTIVIKLNIEIVNASESSAFVIDNTHFVRFEFVKV